MSFRKFLFYGVGEELKRKSYQPQDTIEAKKTSYDYSGKVTKKYFDLEGNNKVYWVDGAVEVKVPMAYERKQFQQELNGYKMKANVGTVLGVAGFGYSFYQFAMGDYIFGAAGVMAGLSIAIYANHRADQADQESRNWDNPIKDVCRMREAAAKNFNSLQYNNLKGSHFTLDETRDVLHESVKRSSEEFEKTMAKGNPCKIMEWTQSFSIKNPLLPSGVQYAFGESPEDFDSVQRKSVKLLSSVESFNEGAKKVLETPLSAKPHPAFIW